jgi:hypothetical protein
MPAPLPYQAILPLDSSNPADIWVERLSKAFADASRTSGFLTLAESAVEACPGNPIILTLAAMSALLDERPERTLAFLKRLSKRYSATPTDHLLHALALFQDNKRVAARALLVRHELTEWPAACRAFPGGPERVRWLLAQLDAVMDRDNAAFGPRPMAMRSKSGTKPMPQPRPAGPLPPNGADRRRKPARSIAAALAAN